MHIILSMGDAVSIGLLWSMVAMGVYITYKILDFADLTVDGSFTLGAAMSAAFIVKGLNPFLSLVLAVLAGALAGMTTGFAHTKLKIPGILASIMTQIGLYSINMRIMGAANISLMQEKTVFSPLIEGLGWKRNLSIGLIGLICSLVVLLLLYLFFQTEIGSGIRATGSNPKMASSVSIDTKQMTVLSLAIGNGLVAFAGALIAQSQRNTDIGMGQGVIIIALASISIGEALFPQKKSLFWRFLGVLIGSVIYRLIIAIVLQLGMPADDQNLLTAIMVAIALSSTHMKEIMKNWPLARKRS